MRRKETLFIILLILALSPYFFICMYAMPFADDYCYAWTSGEGTTFIHRFLYQYLRWSGRYSAHVLLCNHPLVTGRLLFYQAPLFIGLMSVLIGLFGLMCRFLSMRIASVSALTMLLFYLCYMPQITEGVYWFTGICNYELSTVCFIFHLVLLMLWYGSSGLFGRLCFVLAAVLLIICIGFNEIAAALMPSYYLIATVIFYRKKESQPVLFRTAVILLGIVVLSSACLLFAPGNLVRSSKFHTHYQWLHSALYASLQTVRFTMIWLCTLPALGLSLLALSKAHRLPDHPILKFDYRLIAVLMIFTVFMGAFLPYLTTGILGQHRTINYVFMFFILFWLWMLISIRKQFSLDKFPFLSFADRNSAVLLILCILIMAVSANSRSIVLDIYHDRFAAYKKEFLIRQDNIIKHPEARIPVLKNMPETFKIADAMSDSTCWIDQCMRYSQIELK